MAESSRYSDFFPSALTFAHLARAAAASLALTAGLLRRSRFLAAFGAAAVPFTLAHLAFVPAMMAALPAALNRLLPFFAGLDFAIFLNLAQRALTAAIIRALPARDMRRRRLAAITGIGESLPAAMESSWPCSVSICSLMAIMRLSWLVVKSAIFVIGH
jgi:hypothetical protein